MVAALAVIGTWWIVAHNGGSGWIQVLGDLVFGALFIGVLGPAVLLRRAEVKVVSTPADATTGLPMELWVDGSTRLRVRPTDMAASKDQFVGPNRKRRSGAESITLLPDHRGVYDSLTLDLATAAPFGVQWWTRRVTLPLPAALHVAPRLGPAVSLPPRRDELSGDSSQRIPADVGEPRGVRPYRPGDSRRHVHWPSTAHGRELMVRELEGPTAEPVTVTISLPDDPDRAERIAEQALGTVVRLIDRGTPVLLETTESTGPLKAQTNDRRSAGRRIARAVATSGVEAGVVVSA